MIFKKRDGCPECGETADLDVQFATPPDFDGESLWMLGQCTCFACECSYKALYKFDLRERSIDEITREDGKVYQMEDVKLDISWTMWDLLG